MGGRASQPDEGPPSPLFFDGPYDSASPNPDESSPPALASSPAAQQLGAWRPRRRSLITRPARASRSSSVLARGASAWPRQQPRLVAAQSHPPPPLPAVRRDAETGLALLLVVLAAVMSCFLSLTILSFSACKVLHKLEMTANKLAKVVAEEAPGTLSSLKLSFLEISDLTSQIKNFRKRLTEWPKQGNT